MHILAISDFFKVYSDSKWKILINDRYTTTSSHLFAICMSIFHKTEVQTDLMGLNLDWFKSYGLRCNLRLCALLANSQKIATDKWPFYDHIWPFFCQLYVYLSQNWDSDGHFEVLYESESYLVQKLWHKMQKHKKANECFCTKSQKTEMEIFAFCIIT